MAHGSPLFEMLIGLFCFALLSLNDLLFLSVSFLCIN